MGADSFKGKLLLVKELHQRWPADTEQVRCLLSGKRLRLRQDTDSEPSLHGLNYLPENPMDLLRNFHLVTRSRPGEEIPRKRGLSTGRFMRREKIVYTGDTSQIVADVCLLTQCHRVAHNYSLSERNVTHLCTFRLGMMGTHPWRMPVPN